VRFWDSSAVVPILVDEPMSMWMRELAEDGSGLAVWWATPVECISAIARRERSTELDPESAQVAASTLGGLSERWIEIPPVDRVRESARRIVATHELRAGDAFQLAAARVASKGKTDSLPFVTLNERLALAARREGFPVPGL
jgi:predicted nucleic acid-binding protein